MLLLEAHDYACGLDRDLWHFGVEINCLRAAGLTNSDLRWLLSKEYLEHAYEITTADDEIRRFHTGVSPRFVRESCFVPTQAGVVFARNVFGTLCTMSAPAEPSPTPAPKVFASDPAMRPVPVWDGQRRELCLNGQLIKQFKAPAGNQEMILTAFEEECWPPHVDDPLPPRSDLDPKRRLHATINSLNRNQRVPLLRFLGDGTGQGIRWEFVSPPVSSSQTQEASPGAESNGHDADHESHPGESASPAP